MDLPPDVLEAALQRARQTKRARRRALQRLLAGDRRALEPGKERGVRRIAARVGVDDATAAALHDGADPAGMQLSPQQVVAATAIVGERDFLSMAFLERGRRAGNAVGRLVGPGGPPAGTCFMISPALLITNNHVMSTPEIAEGLEVEFELDVDVDGNPAEVARFGLAPRTFFLTDATPTMDFTVVALGAPVSAGASAGRLSFCRLTGANDVFALGDFVNIIQHPDGGPKQVVLRENRLVLIPKLADGTRPVLQYVADTLDSSSGSPVFNDEWNVMALHHSSVPAGDITLCGTTRLDVVNEGTRASVIVKALRDRRSTLTPKRKALLDDALRE